MKNENEIENEDEFEAAYRKLSEALSKYIGVLPVRYESTADKSINEFYICGYCGKGVGMDNHRCNYCPNCGHKVNWEEK